jgi:hypothetical protein
LSSIFAEKLLRRQGRSGRFGAVHIVSGEAALFLL